MMAANAKTKINNIKTEYSSIFGTNDKVGTIGTITDGTYNAPWVIYTIIGNIYQLFPLRNLGDHVMNSTDTSAGGYNGSELHTYIHNTVLSNLKKSGLNIASCDLVSLSVYMDIVSKTGMLSEDIAGGEFFWLTDPHSSNYFYSVDSDGSIIYYDYASYSLGVRPLITVVK